MPIGALKADPVKLQAFARLLLEHQSSLRAYIVSLMPGCDDAEDVLQDTNLVIWEKMVDYRDGTEFRAWIFAIARNMVKAQFRKRKRNRRLMIDDELIQAVDDIWHQRTSREFLRRQKALDRCLEALNDKERQLIAVRYGKTSNLEIFASEIGRPADSLRTTLSRIRHKLRDCVRKRLTMEGGVA